MDISRRTFVMFGVGAAAGFVLGPINWKLMDDGAIWTQNWPWVPVPEDGETSYATSTCKLCPGACGIKVRLIDGKRAIKIDGDPDHPVNKGGICALGLSGLQVVYGPDRIKSPLRRDGERGSGQWKAISWEEAISQLSAKLSEQRMSAKPHSVALINGERNGAMNRFWERFLRSYGSPNHVLMPSLSDTEEAIGEVMHGVRSPMGYDLEGSGYILSFGAELLDGWGSPVRMMLAYGNWRGGEGTRPRLVHVSSMSSMSSSKADEWVAVRPGTEAALALGMANVILNEGLAKGSGGGMDAFRQVASEYTPDRVSLVTGVKAEDIARLAREFAAATHPVAVWGRGRGDMPERLADAGAVQCLNALVGAVGATGGVAPQPAVPLAGWGEAPVDMVAAAGLGAGRLDGTGGGWPPAPGARGAVGSLAHDFLQAADQNAPYGVNVLMVYEANPAYSLAEARLFREAAGKIPYIVSFASSMDETAAMADLILPNHTYLERWDSTLTPPGLQYPLVSLTKPVIDPLYQTRHTAEVMMEVAKAVGGSAASALPWSSAEEMVKSEVASLVGEGLVWCDPAARGGDSFGFAMTLPGREESRVPNYQSANLTGSAPEYPLLLMPFANARMTQNNIANPPYMTKTLEDTVLFGQDLFVRLSPVTAGDLEIEEGDAVELKTPGGTVKVRVTLDLGIPPGVVGIPQGLGHVAQSEWIAGKGINANDVLMIERDPLSGLARWHATRARVTKI
ncbi:MAG: molybdopterin-dependent oxidoreductase [Pseudomonadota bacterium]